MINSAKKGPPKITWQEMVAKEPWLDDLLVQATQMQPDANGFFCRDRAWQCGWKGQPTLKRQLSQLVGHFSPHAGKPLGTSDAWEVAIKALLEALPPCSNCACVDESGNFVT